MVDSLALSPLMVSADDAAKLIGVSPATWHRMNSAGKIPAPVKLSVGCVRWRVSDLQFWVGADCPDRKTWLNLKNEETNDGN